MNILSQLTSTILDADSYKVSHWAQYPEGTEYVSSYIEARSSKYAKTLGAEHNYALLFGVQAYVKEYLTTPITQDDINLAEILFRMHGEPFNKKGWQYILDHHNGVLPLEVRALPEGTLLPTSNALVEIINTDPKCFWLTSYVETAMLRAVWYPTTVATKSRVIKEICRKALEETAMVPEESLDFMLHDFGARGNSSAESSALGGAAHLVNFKGTDTVLGIVEALANYYPEYDDFLAESRNAKRAMIKMLTKMEAEGRMLPGLSVIASEHSTMTIKGRDGEVDQIKCLIDMAKSGRIVSIVSDSYDYFNNVTAIYGDQLKKDILEVGKNGGRIVIRPDSGDPVDVICKTLEILVDKFSDHVTINAKGYKVLPPCLRILQGDGIDLDTVGDILKAVKAAGFSAENLVFGMGGGLEQKVNRDDLNFAQKASAAKINGVWHDVYKDPVTADPRFVKKSKKGRLSTVWDGVAFTTKRTEDLTPGETDRLHVVYRNGDVMNEQSFDVIRETAETFAKIHREPPQAPISNPWPKSKTPKASI